MKLSDIIKQLKAESSTNAKLAILKENVFNEHLRQYFLATLNPFINYWIRVDAIPDVAGKNALTSDIINNIVNTLNGRVLTGNAAREYVHNVLLQLTEEDQILLRNMINRDPDCKIAEGLVNKCWKNLIPSFPVMLAEKLDEKTMCNIVEGPNSLIVQKKEDGGRVSIVVDHKGSVTVYSRNGNILEIHSVFDAAFSKFTGMVFDGELLVIGENGMQDRKTGNGIFNKAVRKTISLKEALSFHAVLWDVIELDKWKTGYDSTPYTERLKQLIGYVDKLPSHQASLVETKIVSTYYEAQKFYGRMIDAGFEGAMIKVASMPWENKRSKYVLKMKETNDATLRCVAVLPHSKNPSLIGSLECVTSDGLLRTSVGSGLTDDDRKQPVEYFLNKLIDVQYNMLITCKNKTEYSMFLPRYMRIRLDQNCADTLEKLK